MNEEKEILIKKLKAWGLPEKYWYVEEEDWDKKEVFKMINEEESYYFYGGAGTGKTMLACIIGKRLIRQGKHCLFITAPDFLGKIVAGFNFSSSYSSSEEVLEKYSKANYLILDDLGAERSSEFAIQQLYRLISYRERNLKPVIITSNLTLGEIAEKLSDRIASRIKGMCGERIIYFGKEDKRLLGKDDIERWKRRFWKGEEECLHM